MPEGMMSVTCPVARRRLPTRPPSRRSGSPAGPRLRTRPSPRRPLNEAGGIRFAASSLKCGEMGGAEASLMPQALGPGGSEFPHRPEGRALRTLGASGSAARACPSWSSSGRTRAGRNFRSPIPFRRIRSSPSSPAKVGAHAGRRPDDRIPAFAGNGRLRPRPSGSRARASLRPRPARAPRARRLRRGGR